MSTGFSAGRNKITRWRVSVVTASAVLILVFAARDVLSEIRRSNPDSDGRAVSNNQSLREADRAGDDH